LKCGKVTEFEENDVELPGVSGYETAKVVGHTTYDLLGKMVAHPMAREHLLFVETSDYATQR